MTTEQRTPEQWCQHYGLTVIDPGGWRTPDAPAWEQPIGLPEFWRRYSASTVDLVETGKYAVLIADVRAAQRGEQERLSASLTRGQVTVRTVADFLTTADGPFQINPATARALGAIFRWHANLDSDQNGDNEVILTAAKAFDVDPGCNDTTGAQLAQLAQQLAVLLQVQSQCATCVADARQGARPDTNFVNVIIDGSGYCHQHVDVVNGRLVPKTGSGIVLGGGTMGR